MMLKKWILLMLAMLAASVCYADDESAINDSVSQGAQEYNWQSCIDAKMSDCMASCETSEDPECKDNCADLANDKCQSQGLSPTQ